MIKTTQTIKTRLKEIEEDTKIKILYAVESGSRGWGFESKDSDYDIRFIYAHPMDWYLSIGEERDVIEFPIADLLDFSGWDIKKALNLFKNSNPTLYEWLSSPIVYSEDKTFVESLKTLAPNYFSPGAGIHHYLNMAKNTFKTYLCQEKVNLKKYFYALRPILACMWVENQKSIPPMAFKKLLISQNLNQKLTDEVNLLLQRKKSAEEIDSEPKIELIHQFIEEKINYYEKFIKRLKSKGHVDSDHLDQLFRDTISF